MEKHYVDLRNRYSPKKASLIFILESPPASHGYVYDPSGRTSEILFRAFMKLINFTPSTKDEGLKQLKAKGWLLVDPIYTPVNKLPDKVADEMILKNYGDFKKDLLKITGGRPVPIVIVKSNILKLLESKLLSDGFNVLNQGLMVPFPMHYHAGTFNDRVKSLIAGLLTKNTIFR